MASYWLKFTDLFTERAEMDRAGLRDMEMD
jgi:hypothetical protein